MPLDSLSGSVLLALLEALQAYGSIFTLSYFSRCFYGFQTGDAARCRKILSGPLTYYLGKILSEDRRIAYSMEIYPGSAHSVSLLQGLVRSLSGKCLWPCQFS